MKVNGKIYMWKRLAWGLSCAPEIQQKLMEPICWWLKHNHGANAYVFYDDLVITGLEKDKLRDIGKKLVNILKDIGFDINADKCDLEPVK